eukprot:jgi/Botrbrau1/9675/Bobra.0201s0009.1
MALKLNCGTLLAEKRTRFLTAVRRTYEDFFHDAYINSSQVFYLRDSADRALDEVQRPLWDWHFLRPNCNLRWVVRWLQRFARFNWLAGPLHTLLLEDLRTRATMVLAFCHAHAIVAAELLQYDTLGTIEEWTEEQSAVSLDTNFTVLHRDMIRNVTMQVVAESRGQLALAQKLLAHIKEAYPEVLRSIKTTQLAQELLLYKEELLKEIGATGLIEDSELEQMQHLVEKKLKRLHFHPPRSTGLHPADLLARHPIFADIPSSEFSKQVLRSAALRVYEEGDVLNSAGKDADAVVVILRGSARLIPGDPELKRKNVQPFIASASSVLFCWPALLEVVQPFQGLAATIMLVYRIPLATFRQLMSKYKSVSDGAWQACGAALAHAHGGPLLASRTFNQLCVLFREAAVEALEEGAILRVAGTAFLVYGSVQQIKKDSNEDVTARYQGPCLLPSHPENYICIDKVKVLHLPPEYDAGEGDGGPDEKAHRSYSFNGAGNQKAPAILAGSPTDVELGATWSASSMGGEPYPADAAPPTPTLEKTLSEERSKALHPDHKGAGGKSDAKELQSEHAGSHPEGARGRGRRAGLTGWVMSRGLETDQGSVSFEESLFLAKNEHRGRSSPGSPRAPTPEVGSAATPHTPALPSGDPNQSYIARMVSAIHRSPPLVAANDNAIRADTQITAAELKGSAAACPVTGTSEGPEPSGDFFGNGATPVTDGPPGKEEGSGQEGPEGRQVKRVSIAPGAEDSAVTIEGAPRMRPTLTSFRSTLHRNSEIFRNRYVMAQAVLQEDLALQAVHEGPQLGST